MSNDNNHKDIESQVLKGEEGLLLDHNYDGIKELDHPLPGWWLTIFYVTIVFAVAYAGYYMLGPGPSLHDEYVAAMAKIDSLRAEEKAKQSPLSDETIVAHMKTPEGLKHGAEIFASKCLACHGDKGQGVVGPNLTDDHWIHGNGTPAEIAKTVSEGVLDKGMPNWSAVLSTEEIIDVVAFVRSIHGTNPAGGKPPEGQPQEFKEF